MKTVVFQSFRNRDVPKFVVECCASVRAWAQGAGHGYEFLDDRFLELAPAWYREKAGPFLCVVTDLARLLQAQRFLLSGWERVVWCDADLLVFRPELFALQEEWSASYCKEVWVTKDTSGNLGAMHKVNNSMCVFTEASLSHLEEYIARCYEVVNDAPAIVDNLCVGTDLLTSMYASRAVITCVGMVSPALMEAVLEVDELLLSRYRATHGFSMYAVNLCNAQRQGFGSYPKLFDYVCAGVVDQLRSGRSGELLSQS